MRAEQATAGAESASVETLHGPWTEPDWAEETAAWLGTHLTDPGPLRIKHTRTWSMIGNVESVHGLHWLKQVGWPIGHEPSLTETLARLVPRFLPEVVAADDSRLLTRHVRRRLDREVKHVITPLWDHVVARYAEFQIETVPFAAGLTVPDGSPEAIAARFGERVEPVVAALGETVPLTLVHLSVSDKNVCLRDGEPVFIDWAAGVFAHPFCGMAKTLRVLVRHYGAVPGGPELERIRDAYLEPWTVHAPLRELRNVFSAAYALGALCRAAAKERVLNSLTESVRPTRASGVANQLEAFENAMSAPTVLGV